MIDRDTIIDFVAAVDTEFEKLEVGTYNGFDLYERFAMYIEAKVRKEEREACAKVCEVLDDGSYAGGDQPYGTQYARAIRARGQG
jgi:hypothetical protein